MKRIFLTAYFTWIYEWERKYYDNMEYDGSQSLRLVEVDSDGRDQNDPCADDLLRDRTIQRKIWNWTKKGVKPRVHKRKNS